MRSTARVVALMLIVAALARADEPRPPLAITSITHLAIAARVAFETTQGSARAAARLVTAGLPLDTVARLDTILAALSPADVARAVELDELSIVVVGDWATFGSALRDLGLPIEAATP